MDNIAIPTMDPEDNSPTDFGESTSPDDLGIGPSNGSNASREPQSGKAAKAKPRRSCAPCQLRRVKCERLPGQNDCIKCQNLKINCLESTPKSRSSQKGARIAEAKRLFGDTDSNNSVALVAQPSTSTSTSLQPLSFSSTAVRLSDGRDASQFLARLIPELSTFKVASYPLLRWIDLPGAYADPNCDFFGLEPIDQALYLILGALAARSSGAEFLVGPDAPSIKDISQNAKLREGTNLCQYGARRERLAGDILQSALQKIHDCGIFSATDLRSVVALTVAEMLILVYRDALAFTRRASREARPFSAAAATHLRILAEDHVTDEFSPTGWYSVAYTLVIRDALIASATGRALDYTSSDLFLIIKVNEQMYIPIPSGSDIAHSWIDSVFEGPALMSLWMKCLQWARRFVLEISQRMNPSLTRHRKFLMHRSTALAIAQPRLKLEFFDKFFADLDKCRSVVNDTIRIAREIKVQVPDIVRVLEYNLEFLIVQAYRIIAWRHQPEQLAKADVSGVDTSYHIYTAKLQELKQSSEHAAFNAGRRVLNTINNLMKFSSAEAAEFFLPGYVVYEGLLLWASLLLESEVVENGGRLDYDLSTKIADLRILRDALSCSSWSSSTALPHLLTLDTAIQDLESRRKPIAPIAPIPSDIELINMLSTDISAFPSNGASSQSTLSPAIIHGLFGEPNLQFGQSFDNTSNVETATDWLDAFLASNPFPWPMDGVDNTATVGVDSKPSVGVAPDQNQQTFDPSFFTFADAPGAGPSNGFTQSHAS